MAEEKRLYLCLPHILPFLHLADVVAVSQANKRLEKIVAQFFTSGRLIIDKEWIDAIPICNNGRFYNLLGGEATTVNISGIDEESLELFFGYLPKIIDLVLDNVWISRGDFKGAPANIQQSYTVPLQDPPVVPYEVVRVHQPDSAIPLLGSIRNRFPTEKMAKS